MIRQRLAALLLAGAVFTVSACTTAQVQQTEAQIIADIQAGTAAACGIIPTANSIIALVEVLVPGASILSVVGNYVTLIEQNVCAASPPPASDKYLSLPRAGVGAAPAVIGTTGNVVIKGWRVN